MGLLQQLNDISYTLDQRRRNREVKEQQKKIEKMYINEIKCNLQADFYDNFNTYGIKEGYKKSVLDKDITIDYIYDIMYNYYHDINNKQVYIFRQFDIIKDLSDNYYKILNNVKKEFEKIQDISDEEIFQKLENFLIEQIDKAEKKSVALQVLSEKKYIDYTIQYITNDPTQQDTLQDNYYKIYNKVKRLYNGDIQIEKIKEAEKRQYFRQYEKNRMIKKADRLYTLHLINNLLNKIK